MTTYIEREAAAALLEEKLRDICPLGRCSRNAVYGTDRDLYDAIESDIDALNNIPAADVVEVKHGRWVQVICHVEFEDGFVDRLYECCSRCHKPNGRKMTDYCPNCGADMRGDKDGEE